MKALRIPSARPASRPPARLRGSRGDEIEYCARKARICQLARARGIETIVDGAHGFARFPFTRDEPEHTCGLGALAIDGLDAEALTACLERRYLIGSAQRRPASWQREDGSTAGPQSVRSRRRW